MSESENIKSNLAGDDTERVAGAKAVEIKIGQHWQEVDPRVDRTVEILAVGPGSVRPIKLRTIRADGIEWTGGRSTYASRDRFNGKRGGYRLVKDVA